MCVLLRSPLSPVSLGRRRRSSPPPLRPARHIAGRAAPARLDALLVRFAEGTTNSTAAAVVAAAGTTTVGRLGQLSTTVVAPLTGRTRGAVQSALAANKNVASVEADGLAHLRSRLTTPTGRRSGTQPRSTPTAPGTSRRAPAVRSSRSSIAASSEPAGTAGSCHRRLRLRQQRFRAQRRPGSRDQAQRGSPDWA